MQTMKPQQLSSEMNGAIAVRDLYQQLMAAWARGDGAAYGQLFTADADYIAFDGSHTRGSTEIGSSQASGALRYLAQRDTPCRRHYGCARTRSERGPGARYRWYDHGRSNARLKLARLNPDAGGRSARGWLAVYGLPQQPDPAAQPFQPVPVRHRDEGISSLNQVPTWPALVPTPRWSWRGMRMQMIETRNLSKQFKAMSVASLTRRRLFTVRRIRLNLDSVPNGREDDQDG